jgi:hypothetical protein
MGRSVGLRHTMAMVLALAAAMVAVTSVPSMASPVRFGAKLNTSEFPDNAYPGSSCDHVISGGSGTSNCTWIEDQALNNNGFSGAKAPKDGKINKIRLISGHGGSFQLFIGRYNSGTHKGKVVRTGPTITYATDPCSPDCAIQVFTIKPLTVKKGDVLAIKTKSTSILQCNQGSDHISLYKPPLAVGGPLTHATDTDGCYLLLEAQYQ